MNKRLYSEFLKSGRIPGCSKVSYRAWLEGRLQAEMVMVEQLKSLINEDEK